MTRLILENVEVCGDEGDTILSVTDFELKEGTFLALKGVSGAGKSTFLNTITGLISPKLGNVIWGKTNFSKCRNAQKATFRCEKMGLIFQDFPLFEELDLFDNITISSCFKLNDKKTIESNAKRLMKHFAFDDLARNTKSYSGGQKQRIAFMRALVGNPRIIIADEPTAALDRVNSDKMIDFLLEEKKDRTLIVSSHDEYVLGKADRVLTIDSGRIIDDIYQ